MSMNLPAAVDLSTKLTFARHVTCFYNKPAPEVMEGMVRVTPGCLNNTNELAPKVEIWSEEKQHFVPKSKYILEAVEGNGTPERLNALLSSLESV